MKFLKFLAICISAVLSLGLFCSCGKDLGLACDSPISSFEESYPYEPLKRSFSLDRVLQENGISFCFESSLSKKKLEHGIKSVCLAKNFFGELEKVFFLEDGVTCVESRGVWVNPSDPPELVLSVLLESEAEHDLPFGIFAGVARALLKEDAELPLFQGDKLVSSLVKYPYVKDLQYPLYTLCKTEKDERKTAWSFALRLGNRWLEQHQKEDLKTETVEKLVPEIMAIGAELPDFYCPVGDNLYPIQAVTENYHYYFDSEYRDNQLDESDFSARYIEIRDYVTENERLMTENRRIFISEAERENGEPFFWFNEKVNVYWGSFRIYGSPNGYADYRNGDIYLKSVSFSVYLMTDMMLSRTVGLRELHYYISDYFNCESTYCKLIIYDLYKDIHREGSYDKDILKKASDRYDKSYGKADFQSFRPYEYYDCLSQILNEMYGEKFRYMVQFCSFLGYLRQNFGVEMLFDLDRDLSPSGDKTMDELILEWKNYLEKTYGK